MRRRVGPLVLLALLSAACGEPRLADGFAEGSGLTRLRLAPGDFVGDLACRRGVAGALQSYVAVIQEVVPGLAPDAGFREAYTTAPVPCDQAVLFPATAGRLYGAELYGFDRDLGAGVVDLGTARWSAVCGRGRSAFEASDAGLDPYRPTLAQRGLTVPLRGCTSLSGEPGAAPTRLVVDSVSALGSLRCGSAPGQVVALRGTLAGVTRSAACGQPLAFDVAEPDRYYTIELVGLAADGDAGAPDAGAPDAGAVAVGDAGGGSLDAGPDASQNDALDASAAPAVDAGASPAPGGVPRWQTRCTARALANASVPAICAPLRPLP